MLFLIGGCNSQPSGQPPIDIQLFQKWELQPGDTIAGYKVLGGLGDISIALKGSPVYAPFDGEAQIDKRGCVFFSTAEIPAYKFRFCGLNAPQLGKLRQGDTIGSGDTMQFAALRKQPDGKWAIVEPAKSILERTLKAS
ncbi:hypothetical protein [Phormidesmis priestleyi]|uniref:hypothetical protein n=1 Tax=Phormidesmis priestleyi TaxID=268141 RepID=UPI000B275330|nr:hypothetical protein [Phormidesmis priestleyi]